MKYAARVLGIFVALINFPNTARAELITVEFGGATVIDFSQFGGLGYNFTFGPTQIGSLVGLDVVFEANPLNGGNSGFGAVLGSGGYGLSANGGWTDSRTYSGLDSGVGAMTYLFNFGLVSEVGGFVNYAPDLGPPVILEALDSGGRILESHVLNHEAPISTPFFSNGGAFRGIRRPHADIAGFRVSNSYVVLDDLAFSSSATPVPEPSTLVLVVSGAIALASRSRNRWKRGHPRH